MCTINLHPYVGDTILQLFKKERPTFNGDLAHLLRLRAAGAGGRAYVGALCNGLGYGYTDLFPAFNLFPNYSDQVQVVVHELGHNFGSYHTHRCVWNGDNTTIDDYGNYTPQSVQIESGDGIRTGCITANDPTYVPKLSVTPTIMSYYNTQGHGTYPLSNGFGQQPGDLIRNYIKSAPCVDSCATPTCPLIETVTTDITQGVDERSAKNKVIATNRIEGTSQGDYHGGQEVLLKDGFTVAGGATFRAYIESCEVTQSTQSISSNNTMPLEDRSVAEDGLIGSQGQISIHPNPAQDYITITNTGLEQITSVETYNFQGQILAIPVDDGRVDVSRIPSGIYFLRINTPKDPVTIKFIKQ